MPNFEKQLTGGHPNSLGNTVSVTEQVLADASLLEELYNCYFSEDEVVRLRVSGAMKRVCIAQPDWLVPYIDRLLTEISQIDQASTQWTLALLFDRLSERMTDQQLADAKTIVKHNLEHHRDWIVINNSMEVLGKWSLSDADLKAWLRPQLERHRQDPRKSVSGRARKLLGRFYG